MTVYIIFFLIIVGSAVSIKKYSHKVYALFFLAGCLCLLAGLRGKIDADIFQYEALYLNIIGNGGGFVEPGFYLISCLSHWMFHSFQGVVFIYAVLALAPLTYIIIRYWEANLYILLYYYSFFFFLHPMTQIRLSAAIVYLILSVRYIGEKNFKKFLLFVLIGSFFHQTVLLFIPFYFILQKQYSIKTQILWVVVAVFFSQTVSFSGILFDLASILSGNFMATKLLMHQGTLDGGVGARTASVYLIMVLIKIIFNLFLQSRLKKEENKLLHLYLAAAFWGYLIYILFSDIHLIAARIAELFGITEIFYVPCLIKVFRPRCAGELMVVVIALFQLVVSLYLIGFIGEYEFFFT